MCCYGLRRTWCNQGYSCMSIMHSVYVLLTLLFYSFVFCVLLSEVSVLCFVLDIKQTNQWSSQSSSHLPCKIADLLLNIAGSWPKCFPVPFRYIYDLFMLKNPSSQSLEVLSMKHGRIFPPPWPPCPPPFLVLQHKPSQENNKQMSGMGTAPSESSQALR